MFNLATDVGSFKPSKHLDSQLRQIAPNRPIDHAAFVSGNISFKFAAAARDMWFVAAESYLRMRVRLSWKDDSVQAVERPLDAADGVAPALNLGQALFDNIDFLLGGKSVSSNTNYVPEIATLRARRDLSDAWLMGIGDTATMWKDFKSRQARVCLGTSSNGGLDYTDFPMYQMCNMSDLNQIQLDGAGRADFTTGTGTPIAGVDLREVLLPGDEIWVHTGTGMKSHGVITEVHLNHVLHLSPDTAVVPASNLANIIGPPTTGTFMIRRYSTLGVGSSHYPEFEIAFRPPSALFYSLKTAMPQSGEMELRLHPSLSYKYNAVEVVNESQIVPWVQGTAGYHFDVLEMYFYAMETRGPEWNGGKYFLDLEEVDAQVNQITTVSNQQSSFNVPPKTNAVTVAFTDSRTISDARASVTKFNSYGQSLQTFGAAVPTVVQERYMLRSGKIAPVNHRVRDFQMQYAGRQFPPLRSDELLTGPDEQGVGVPARFPVNYLTQSWFDALIWNGKSGAQTAQEDQVTWLERGMYFHFMVDKPSENNATSLNITQRFDATDADISNTQIIIFTHTRVIVEVGFSSDRRVVSVIRNAVA